MFNLPGKSMFSLPQPMGRSRARRPSFSVETQQFFDRLVTPPDASRKVLYATLIDSLVATGVWAVLDQLFVAASDDATFRTNLIQNDGALIEADLGGILTYVADRGFEVTPGAGQGSFLAALYPASSHRTQDSASWCGWVRGPGTTPPVSTATIVNGINASGGPGNELLLVTANATPVTGGRISATTGNFTASDANGAGFYLITRTGATSSRIDKNASTIATGSGSSTGTTNTGFTCNFSEDRPLAAIGSGGGVDTAQSAALYSALNDYLTAIGAV